MLTHTRTIVSLSMLAAVLATSACGGGSQSDPAAPIGEMPATPTPDPSPETTTLAPHAENPTPLQSNATRDVLTRVADHALTNADRFKPQSWVMAPLYDGLIDASLVTGDARYLAAVLRVGKCVAYESGSRLYHADGHAAGRSWLRIHQMMQPKNAALLKPWVAMFDKIIANPIVEEWQFGEEPPQDRKTTDRWVWTDALYMAPPTIVVLAQITRNPEYLEFMDSEYRFAHAGLYDSKEKLFYRDARYIDQRTPNGEKVFWSRGNAWVYAGLALVLDALPEDHPSRDFYVSLFREMTTAIVQTQQVDGFWYTSLKDPQHVPIPETSGTALFVLGLAHGVRLNLIDPATAWPAIERGWNGILTKVDREGAVTSVQPPASLPKMFDASSRVAYGTGAVLSAGSAILRALGENPTEAEAELVKHAIELSPMALDLSTEMNCDDAEKAMSLRSP